MCKDSEKKTIRFIPSLKSKYILALKCQTILEIKNKYYFSAQALACTHGLSCGKEGNDNPNANTNENENENENKIENEKDNPDDSIVSFNKTFYIYLITKLR